MTHSVGIPSVDLNDFLSDNKERKMRFVQELGKAYQDIGFVALKGHFLNEKLANNLYNEVIKLYNLPIEVKQRYEVPGLAGQRGYTSFGKEHAKGRTVGDLKEFWQFGQYVTDGDAVKSEYPDNVIVDEIPEFNIHGKEVY